MGTVQMIGAIEFFLHIGGDGGIQLRFHGREVIIDGIGNALREQRGSIEFEQILLHQSAHDVGNVDALIARPTGPFKAIRVNEGHEQLEILFLAVMRRGCQQQEMAGDPGKHSAELVSLGIFNFTAPHGSGHFVRFVANDQVPIRCAELVLQLLIARELVQTGDAEIDFVENVSRYGGFQAVIGQNFKAQMEFLIELVLPLLSQIAR